MSDDGKPPMNVLVLNSGSSSVRFQLIQSDGRETDRRLANGRVERVGGHALITRRVGDGPKAASSLLALPPLRPPPRGRRGLCLAAPSVLQYCLLVALVVLVLVLIESHTLIPIRMH